MKREEVLFYLSNDKIHIYLENAKREIIEEVDTSTFFKYGEISNVYEFTEFLNDFISKKGLLSGILKPDLYVLYNDVCNSDMEFLYRESLNSFNFNEIHFIGMSKLVNVIKNDARIVFYDKNYYTIFSLKLKTDDISKLEFEPILIGVKESTQLHFSENDLIWKTFKTHFTNL